MEQQKRLTSPTDPTVVRDSHQTQPPQETHFNTSHPPSNTLLSTPNTLPSQTGLAQGQQTLPNNPRLAPDPRRAITRPPDSWTSSMPHARESQATTMGFYHPAPTGLGGPETESISAAPGLWGDSYTAMAAAGSSYWYEPTSATSNTSSGTANHDMSADGNSDGMETLELDHHAAGYHSQGGYTTSESGIFLGGMEWNSNAIAPGMNPEMQRRMAKQGYEPQAQPGGLVPADPNLFAEFTLSSNAPSASTPSYAGRGFGPHLDDRWQRRGSSAALSIGSDAPRRGQPGRATRRASAAQDLKSKREQSHKSHRATSSPQRGAKEGRTSDRTTHNDVERKYRMNLKDKIAELRAAIPALQTGSEGEGSDPGTGATGNPKVSKGTVLSKATEYIHELEEMNRNMATEHHHLVQRLHELESLLQDNSSGRHRAQFPPAQGLGNFESGTFD